MSPLRVLVALPALLALLGGPAAAAETFRCAARGGAAWREYRSRHFLVDTDVSRSTAQGLVDDLERTEALLLAALVGEAVEIPGRIRVVAFGDPGAYRTFALRDSSSYSLVTRRGEAVIVLPVERVRGDRETIAFQIAAYLSWHLFPRQAPWFRTGLATFAMTVGSEAEFARKVGSTVQVGERAPRRAVGLAPREMLVDMQHEPIVPPAELLAWDGDPGKDDTWGRYNHWSWLLYHWLWNTRSKALADLQARLGAGEAPAAAWRAAFPDLDPADRDAMAHLERALEAYRRAGRYAYYVVSASYEASSVEAPVAPADLHMLLLDARQRWPEKREDAAALARAEVEEALREDGTQPEAIARRARDDGSSPLAALRAATSARPGDWRAFYELGRALNGAAAREREAAYEKAAALGPDSAAAQEGQARTLLAAGRAREALPFANRAVDLAPWDAQAIDSLAAVAVELGRCEEGLALERRAAERLAATDARAEELRARFAAYEKRCTAAGR